MALNHFEPFVPAKAGTQGNKSQRQSKEPLGSRFRGNERVESESIQTKHASGSRHDIERSYSRDAFDLDTAAGAAGTLLSRNDAAVGIIEPQPQQMALALLLRPVLVFATGVQHDKIVEELDVATLEIDVERALFDCLPINLDRLLLRRRELRHCGQLLRLVDRGAHAGRAEIAVREREDRLLEIRQLARRDLAAARAIEVLGEDFHQVVPSLQHAVINRDRARDPALAAALRGIEAKQAHIVASVGMEAHLGGGHVAARMRILVVAAQILHVAENMAELVLRHGLAKPAAQTHIGNRCLLALEPVEREILHHDDAATLQELSPHIGEHLAERLKRKALAFEVDDRHTGAPTAATPAAS